VQVNIKNLIDDVQCYQTVRELRWPDGVPCPSCESKSVIKRGFDDTEPARQRYECHDCDTRFDDLTDTIFAGHDQPLKVWILCPYFMGLNVSNEQIAHELSINASIPCPTEGCLVISVMMSSRHFSKTYPRKGAHSGGGRGTLSVLLGACAGGFLRTATISGIWTHEAGLVGHYGACVLNGVLDMLWSGHTSSRVSS
jgi:transposase-like protein